MAIFSKRTRRDAPPLGYDISEVTRNKLLHTLQHVVEQAEFRSDGSFEELLQEVGKQLLREYGGLRASSYVAAQRSEHPVIEHFFCCEVEEVLDFLELSFHSFRNSPGEAGVKAINAVFREDGVGYELTPLIRVEVDNPDPNSRYGDKIIQTTYPIFIRIDGHFSHQNIIEPCMRILGSRFNVANEEMLKAHSALRAADYPSVITDCASAFESTLKSICEEKNWHYEKSRDTCSALLEVCRAKKLFPEFYIEGLKFTGILRNKLGSAHGRGPNRHISPDKAHAEHMLNLTAAHIVLLARLAGMD
jgi:hypothetical protein